MIDRTDDLAGRFIIVFKNNQDVTLLPDATSSVPVFYSTLENKQVMASRQNSIADTLGLELSKRSLEISVRPKSSSRCLTTSRCMTK
ncbi:MAG: hypothetical protein U5K84_06495 [Alkalibacterium sp.]|nr:hypothetical protein [Alkalibacterium sp.]